MNKCDAQGQKIEKTVNGQQKLLLTLIETLEAVLCFCRKNCEACGCSDEQTQHNVQICCDKYPGSNLTGGFICFFILQMTENRADIFVSFQVVVIAVIVGNRRGGIAPET